MEYVLIDQKWNALNFANQSTDTVVQQGSPPLQFTPGLE